MKDIRQYARRLEILCYALIPLFVFLEIFLRWFQDKIPGLRLLDLSIDNLADIPMSHRLLGVFATSISVIIMVWGLVYLIKTMRSIQQGKIFSYQTTTYFKRMNTLFLWLALYTPLHRMLFVLTTTLHNPPGQRMLSFGFTSGDLTNILIFAFFLVITSMMQEGSRIQEDLDLTV